MTETLVYATHLRVLSESYQMNTNMTGFGWFSKSLHRCALDKSSLLIGSVKSLMEYQLTAAIMEVIYGKR